MGSDVFGIVGSVQSGVFEVREVVAEGGFAVVYRAEHQGFRANVALKCLKVPGALTEQARTTFLEKFRAEGELLFRLSAAIHAVVRPLHFGTIDNEKNLFVPFMALEWLEGETLDRLIRRRVEEGKPPLGVERAVRLLGPVARALERAHHFPSERGEVSILHRDLKPENVFVAEAQGQELVKILDFGIGTVKSAATQIAGRHSVDADGFSAFTPAYGAPEQWLPKRFGQTGTWTDVWGWALTVIEAAVGYCPMEGDAAAIMGTALDERSRPTPKTLGVPTSAAIDAVFARALAIDPRDRYQDIGVFWDDLERLVGCQTARVEKVSSVLESLPPPGALVPELSLPDLVPRKSGELPAVRAQAPTVLAPATAPELASRTARPSDHLQRGSTWEQSVPGPSAPPDTERSGLQLGGSIAPGSSTSSARRPVIRHREETMAGDRLAATLWGRVDGALKLLGVAVAIAAADWVYFLVTGAPFRLGPVRSVWIAGPIAVVAFVRLVLGLVRV